MTVVAEYGNRESPLIIHNALLLQLLEKSSDVVANLGRVGGCVLTLQFPDDLEECPLSVATLEHLPPRTLQLDGAFGKQDHAIFLAAAPATSCGQARAAVICWR